jgi:hypothetical protein
MLSLSLGFGVSKHGTQYVDLHRNAESDEKQDSDQGIQNRFRSGGYVLQKLTNFVYKQID